jgi:alpha-methylacyl-CoA racemase
MAFTYPPLDENSLRGVTVVDLTRLFPGPFCTQLLADLGARVIKVEPADGGDYARWYPPIGEHGAYGSFFASVNRGKWSVAVDLRRPEGVDVLRDLLRRADVLVEGFRPGVMEKWGLGLDALANVNAQLIVCRITGYGQDGPDALLAGHDLNYLARSGVFGAAGTPEAPPLPLPVQVADLAGGALYAAFGIATALYRRTRTHHGCLIDVSMTEGAASLFGPAATGHFSGPGRGEGMLSGQMPCYRCYQTSDGRVVTLAALEPKFWSATCAVLGRPDWTDRGFDPTLIPDVAALLGTWTVDEFRARFGAVDACAEVCRTWDEVLQDAHLLARKAVHLERQSVLPPTSRMAALENDVPRLGEQTVSSLQWAGVPADRVQALVQAGVLVDGALPGAH